ncbi:MAG: transglutaminase [Betaproteobacteria bacterium RIFCSPLOWO2_02_67_12]|nr:MAG: transglutaminase [Betaproteobacteria bacterium RIFCSPLOWO2_02_67_12]OGA29410.1 MAG: transglutaminase [Betaproteobacteria bacterium RIFCSPLOWO2_02_FULL_68_150]
MRLNVLHETRYRYSSPVVLSQQLLHLTPRTLPWQACRTHRITVAPQAGEFDWHQDYYGNPIVRALLAAPHEALLVRAESEVEVAPREQAALAAPQIPWETLRERLHALDAPPLEPADFLYESPHVETWHELADYAAKSFRQGHGALEAARDLARRIHKDYAFDRKATSVATPLRQVVRQRRGVCQDFAHLMIGCLRSLGLPGRYVSGYILTDPPPGRPRLVGADASHAWVSVYCGEEAGWVDIDPTNDCLVDDEHVTLGWGRDFGDVTPMRGVILGGGEQELEVRVTVTPMSGAPLESMHDG